jgi:hypothetical protein
MLKRLLRSRRMQALASSIAASSYALTQINRATAGEDPEDGVNYYDKIPDSVKQRYWIFIPPENVREAMDEKLPFVGEQNGIKYFKLALPWGLNVFHAFGVAMDKVIKAKDPAEATGYMMNSMVSAFNPLGGSGLMSAVPTAVRPIAAFWGNKDELGRPITPEQQYGTYKSRSDIAFKGTAEWAKALASAFNKVTGGNTYQEGALGKYTPSPGELEYIFNAGLGGIGRIASGIVSTGMSAGKGEAPSIRQVPFARLFVGETSESSDQRKFYDSVNRITRAKKAVEEEGNESEKNITLTNLSSDMDRYLKRVKKLNKRVREAESDDNKELVQELENERLSIMKEFNQLYNTSME